ncbi:MAG: amino acid adenylation domain-containing protein [Mojavia pulchra JT2-VF2]|uniref:Amino acid adenylation domain-containing protein n=1 Tax=Mojavia pulchra JT2-VF2 TaxID=287848 RepID=A0A951PUD1_9NOST|nr:amino acid adenylation domain-containing protein [Mojavia pulchra JT2-VF2]
MLLVEFLRINNTTEQLQLLVECNNTKFKYFQNKCVHDLFEVQVEHTSDAVAVVFKDQQLTYRELNNKANQLAHYLQKLGVVPGVLVGICMKRSLEMVVGLLGVLKAGGAYVLLDPAYPQEHLGLILEDSQLAILLTDSELGFKLLFNQAKVVCLDSDWQAIASQSQNNIDSQVTPANLAYTIYTSNSTDKLKGVPIPHQAVVNFFTSIAQQPGLTSEEILLAMTTLSLDIAVLEIFLPLIVGAKVYLESKSAIAQAYTDYGVCQCQSLSSELLQNQLQYWQQQLADAPPVLELPTDRPRPPVPSYESAKKLVVLPQNLTKSLKNLCHQEEASLFITLLTAFQSLLHRYSGQEDIIVGSPISRHHHPELQGLAEFSNTLVLRTDLSGNPSFRELLGRIHSIVLNAYNHQDLSFEKLVEELRPEHSVSYHPLFQVMFEFQEQPRQKLEPPSLTEAPLELEVGNTKLDLTLSMQEQAGVLVGIWEYNTDLFDASTITRMAGHFQTLLEGIVANPEQHVSKLPLLTLDEQQQLLGKCNNTEAEYLWDKCIHELFEEQVELRPNAVAVVFEEQHLTYRELNIKANQLAHYLQNLGVGPDVLVGICVERSLEMIIGILGILKAGGAYVPLDPNYPVERLAFILEDAQVSVLLTQQRLLNNLPEHHAQVLCIDSDEEILTQQNSQNPTTLATSENLAYIIYTSGSTGKPKGVLINHSNVVRLFNATEHWYHFNQQDVWTLFHSFAFDFSVWEIWGALVYGGRLVVVPYWVSRSPEAFYDLLCKEQVTVLNQTPSAFQQLIRTEQTITQPGNLALRWVIFGGEALELQSLKPWFTRHGDESPRLVNMYGITETTVHVTYRPITTVDLEQGAGSVIGSPIPDLQVYVLDQHKQLVPVGVPGEMYVGGAGLARGYLNRADLTAKAFVVNPFNNDSKAKLYKTGDLARYLPNGDLEYLGRIDHQVKIRGFRIELGEIEAVLNQHPTVQQTVVIVREDIPGDKRLVAYIVPNSVSTITISELRSFLKDKLPEYMIPAAFVMLEVLPLTSNGKVDRRALPGPDTSSIPLDTNFVPPSNPTEEILAGIWSEVLGVEQVGINNNFFELGGHSLLATQVMSRIRQALAIDISLRSLFENPTVAGLAEVIGNSQINIGDEQNQLIPQLANRESAQLSFAQERLWFLEQLEPNNPTYLIPQALRLQGDLNIPVLQQSLDAIVAHHEILRTTFITSDDGNPIQVIGLPRSVELRIIDLRSHNQSDRQQHLQQILNQEAQIPFDLTSDLMLRASLLQIDQQDHILLVVIHHIASDGWSTGIFWQQLAAVYQAFLHGKSSPLPPLPIQYADFAVWQHQSLSGKLLETELDYWKNQLAGATTVLELPTDRPRSPIQTNRGASQSLLLPQTLSTALTALSRQQGVTLFMTLLAAFGALLHRYTGQEDILIGSPIAGRNRAEIEELIGLFLNTLVLRTNFAGNPSFRLLLERVRQMALGAYAHQNLPFEKLVAEIQPERDTSRNPLFQVLFNMLNLEDKTLDLPGLDVDFISLAETAAKFDLTLYVKEQPQGIHLKLVYNRDLFDAERMKEMLHQFHHLLNQIITAPDSQISSYSLVTPEAQALLPQPSVVLPQPKYELVTTMFTQQVNNNPEQTALRQGDRTWSYSELGTTAQALARVMLGNKVESGDVVAVFGTKSFGLIASMLGVLYCKGVLLTIDPKLPSERQQLILQQAKAKYILYIDAQPPQHQELWDRLTIICIHPDTGALLNLPQDDNQLIELPQIDADDAAYIFFTSGTTGVPKGVLGCHKGLAHFLVWQRQTFAIGKQDRVAQLTGLSFDVVLRDIFLPLTSGATLCLPPEGDNLEPTKILHYLESEQITVLHTVPSLAQSWLANIPSGISLQNLRWLFLAGEPLKQTLVEQWRQAFPTSGEIVNLYGPTETTLAKCYYQVPADSASGVQPIGWPLPQTQALVFTPNNQLCGISEVGEIVLRTPFRSLGYINAATETKTKFVQNPFGNDPQDWLYYTGDLGRYRPDGSLEILGRRDHQLKIRGIRIEPGEIETVLSQHPNVAQSLVIAREDIPGDQRLVAYLVANSDSAPTMSDLRQYLLTKLPQYMIPSAFVLLSAIPVTANGKVDRRALPAPEFSRLEPEATFVAPRNAVERQLTQIWEEVLRVQPIGVLDNFFALGGHSLLATQVISRIRKTFSIEIPLQSLFTYPAIAELAPVIEQHQSAGINLQPQTIPKLANRKSLPLSFAQQRMWFWEQLDSGQAIYHIAQALHLQGDLNVTVLQQSLDAIVAHHESLRTNFIVLDGNPVQVIQQPRPVELIVFNLQDCEPTQRHNQIEQLLQQQTQRPFNLKSDLMLRCCLLQIEPQEYILLLVMHHIASDGWSMGILWRQLADLYQAFVSNKPNPLIQLPIQYADYAVWQRQWLADEVLQNQLQYWQQQLAGAPPVLELPTDRPRPPVQTYQGHRQSLILPQNLSDSLQALSQQEGVTLFMTLLAALQTLLYRYSGQEDILIGSAIAGRNHQEIEGLIGFFVNTLVMRSHLGGNPTFRELLAKVRTMALNAYAHQDLPFEKLVEELQPQRSLSYHPLFQVMFVLQNALSQPLQLPGVTLTPLEVHSGRAKFDLTFELQETAAGIQGTVEYNTDLFDDAAIARMLRHFQTLLEGIVANPAQHICQLPLLTTAERHQLLKEWNHTQTDYPRYACIHQLFEAQVERSPNSIAVIFAEQQLTYQQLNQQANQLAHYLQSLGVGSEVMVGLCAERSLKMIVGLLGILKAGGAYVPLDPKYPQERLSLMLEDAQVQVLLTEQHLIEKLPVGEAKVVYLDSDAEVITQYSHENTVTQTTPDNLAYVIYTSGSTGKPKGVSVLHRGVVRLVKDTNYVNFSPEDVFLQLAPVSFDASTFEIWGCLLNGGKLVVMPPHTPSLPELAQALKHYGVTTAWLTAGLFHLMVDEYVEDLKQVRQLLAGGDVLSVPHVQKLLQAGGECRLINGYGPTENTTFTCCYSLDKNTKIRGSIPIGHPISNTQVYILDRNLQPLPIGIPGELYIGGDGLARDYLNRPELTAEKFIANPFSNQPSDKLYKTGDLCRYLSDGNIEFLGRLDYQVKIRGFRIELGEIETVLEQHPALKQILVMAREDVPGDKRLVAYVVAHSEQVPTINELRSFLREQLPDYMVPTTFVFLDQLPLNSNGKVDRRALPAPDTSSLKATSIVPPRNEVERQLVEIWEKALGVQPIGVTDNFFDLGGHSLLAIKLFWEIEQAFGKSLPLACLFQSGTVEALGKILCPEEVETNHASLTTGQQDKSTAAWSSLVAIQPNGSKPPFFCIHGLGGEVLCFRELAMSLGADQPFYGLQSPGLDGKQPLLPRIEDMAALYIQEIRSIQPHGPYFLGGYSFGGIVAYEMAQQLERQGEKVGLLVMLDTCRPGAGQRAPFVKRIVEHFHNLIKLGPSYLWQRTQIWSKWGKQLLQSGAYHLKKKFKRYSNAKPKYLVDISQKLSDTDQHLEIMENHVQMLNKYTYEVFPGRMLVLRTEDQNRGDGIVGEKFDPQYGWGDMVSGGLDVHYIPGSHLTLLNEPHVQVVAEKLRDRLAQSACK